MFDLSEIRLIRRIRAGNPEACSELYDRYASRLMSYGLQVCGNRAEAEDLVQETILAAWNGRETYQGRVPLIAWMLGILSRRLRDRRRQRTVPTVSLSAEEGAPGISGCAVPGKDMAAGVIDRLSLEDAHLPFREALLLVHSQGLKYREAAEILGEPVGTVKWRVSEALRRVRRYLAATEEEFDGLRQTSARTAG